MYRKKSDGFMYIVASFMVTFVLVFMAGTTYCRVQEEPVEEVKKEVKMVAKIEGWNKNNKDFSIDDKNNKINIIVKNPKISVPYFINIKYQILQFKKLFFISCIDQIGILSPSIPHINRKER